jgi:hypothetical protein
MATVNFNTSDGIADISGSGYAEGGMSVRGQFPEYAEEQAPAGFTGPEVPNPSFFVRPFHASSAGHYQMPQRTSREFSRWLDAAKGQSHKMRSVDELTERRHRENVERLTEPPSPLEPVRCTSNRMLREQIRKNQWGIWGTGSRPAPVFVYSLQSADGDAR